MAIVVGMVEYPKTRELKTKAARKMKKLADVSASSLSIKHTYYV